MEDQKAEPVEAVEPVTKKARVDQEILPREGPCLLPTLNSESLDNVLKHSTVAEICMFGGTCRYRARELTEYRFELRIQLPLLAVLHRRRLIRNMS